MGVNPGDTPATSRLLLASNRLPITVRVDGNHVQLQPSTGGLATGLRGLHQPGNGLWVGWPGNVDGISAAEATSLAAQLEAARLVPVQLTAHQVEGYYDGYSNGVLWPLFHYLLDRIPLEARGWDEYLQVNELFADTLARLHRPGDLLWVHDFHLALLPGLLRARVPDARIGFFLHTPFPSSEIFRILPERAALLRGLLGADLIGFHTATYLRHFTVSLMRILGLEAEVDRVWYEGREVRLGIHPMGIDFQTYVKLSADPALRAESESLRREAAETRIILGVDRLDYTKGIPRRLLAFERLLETRPDLRGRVRMVQVAAPSRVEGHAYEPFKRSVDELVGRINGTYGTPSYVPIHAMSRTLTSRQLVPLYLAADVMAVTPLRDGMNLVAKEFVACRSDLGSVLVVSEFAGAVAELAEALIVNPYDVGGTAETMARALDMPPGERAERMRALRHRVQAHDVQRWASGFADELRDCSAATRRRWPVSAPCEIAQIAATVRAARSLLLFLDYDGTLAPLVQDPEDAEPDAELQLLLERLIERPRTSIHVLSGRTRDSLDRWLGRFPIGLHAEHGLWSRDASRAPWVRNAPVRDDWKEKVRGILQQHVKMTPGSFVEEKSAGLAWHYRRADLEFGSVQSKELRLLLVELLSNLPLEVVAGDKVLEVRPQGVHKGGVVRRVLDSASDVGAIVAIGDDRTDEDLFAALPASAFALRVGWAPSRATHRLADTRAVRTFLNSLLE